MTVLGGWVVAELYRLQSMRRQAARPPRATTENSNNPAVSTPASISPPDRETTNGLVPRFSRPISLDTIGAVTSRHTASRGS